MLVQLSWLWCIVAKLLIILQIKLSIVTVSGQRWITNEYKSFHNQISPCLSLDLHHMSKKRQTKRHKRYNFWPIILESKMKHCKRPHIFKRGWAHWKIAIIKWRGRICNQKGFFYHKERHKTKKYMQYLLKVKYCFRFRSNTDCNLQFPPKQNVHKYCPHCVYFRTETYFFYIIPIQTLFCLWSWRRGTEWATRTSTNF